MPRPTLKTSIKKLALKAALIDTNRPVRNCIGAVAHNIFSEQQMQDPDRMKSQRIFHIR